MEDILEQKEAADWVYRGEGGANLVLAYTGSSPAYIGKVIRIRKALRNGSLTAKRPAALTMHERRLWKDLEDIVSSPNKELRRVLVSRQFLESVEKNVIYQRPVWRVDAAKVDTSSDSVLLLSDHSLFSHGICEGEPCISVEIKPKCGFIPVSKFIDEGKAIKRSISRFRMHQALKLHQGEISECSEYDPIDLFSQSKHRIHKAIMDLFTTPQNNFRVFLNGSLIFGALGGTASITNFEIGEAFEDALEDVILGDHGLRTSSFLQLVVETVYKSGIMSRLLEVQKLDTLDIEGAIHAYYDIISEPCRVCRELGEEKALHRYKSLHSVPLDESLKIVRDFQIATTAKDCSLLISFRRRKDGNSGSSYNNVYLESANQTFDYKKTVVSVELLCSKCRQKVMKLVAMIEGITSIVLDPSKNTVTVTGEADPVRIIKKVRKFRKSAKIISIGPSKDEKKDDKKDAAVVYTTPKTCQRCDVWYVINDDPYYYCSIM